jgi:hypothetical protein
MNYTLAAIIGLFLIGVTPAAAAPQWVEDYCFAKAQQVRPALRWYEQEAYIANCIADYTAAPRAKRHKYKKPRY